MTPTPPPSGEKELTAEQQLSAIIQAQVKGGDEKWKAIRIIHVNFEHGTVGMEQPPFRAIFFPHVLEILLDPEGLRAAYGEGTQKFLPYMWNCLVTDHSIPLNAPFVAHRILDTWLSSGDPTATIQTAFSLLPKQPNFCNPSDK